MKYTNTNCNCMALLAMVTGAFLFSCKESGVQETLDKMYSSKVILPLSDMGCRFKAHDTLLTDEVKPSFGAVQIFRGKL